jgi:hypothetical protein
LRYEQPPQPAEVERVWLSSWTNRHEYAKTDC